MQTFLPYPNFIKSLACLDYRQLGKQRVETRQLINTFDPLYDKRGWLNHPARLMWVGYLDALIIYHNLSIKEWESQGYNNNMELLDHEINPPMPPWLGNRAFHDSHKANLLRKDPEFYGKYGWDVDPEMEYIWPKSDRSL